MKKLYCEYCGELLEENCDCEYEASLEQERILKDYYNSPETQAGWANEDLCNARRMEE